MKYFEADRAGMMQPAGQSQPRPVQVCFFLNAQMHQMMHALPIAFALSQDPRFAVHVLAPTAAHLDQARAMALRGQAGPIRYRRIGGDWLEGIGRLFGGSIPPKLLTLAAARFGLSGFDAIVLPERTSLLLRRLGLGHLRWIHTTHGAGDRAVGMDPRIRQFDYVLLAGEKQRRRMLEAGLVREGGYGVIGYPKLDAVALAPPRPPLFANDRPIVLYNPHCSARLSSWPAMGETILRQLAGDPRWNLIVAPHVKLFDQRGERRRAQRLLAEFANCPNIHIDLGSDRSIDMSYTAMADLYLGDVSSQVYEFILRPRPCLFLNAHGADWQADANYAHWHFGRVLGDVAGLPQALDRAMAEHEALFLPAQRHGLADTFDLGAETSSVRAARALGEFLLRPQAHG